jgi:hypothetical protein
LNSPSAAEVLQNAFSFASAQEIRFPVVSRGNERKRIFEHPGLWRRRGTSISLVFTIFQPFRLTGQAEPGRVD